MSLIKIVESLIKLENSDGYVKAKETLKKRSSLRETVRDELEKNEKMPSNSENYAGLVKTNGRVSYKSAFEQLAQELNVSDTKMMEIVEENRSKSSRLVYGKVKDYEKKGKQLEFNFVTPDYLGD